MGVEQARGSRVTEARLRPWGFPPWQPPRAVALQAGPWHSLGETLAWSFGGKHFKTLFYVALSSR